MPSRGYDPGESYIQHRVGCYSTINVFYISVGQKRLVLSVLSLLYSFTDKAVMFSVELTMDFKTRTSPDKLISIPQLTQDMKILSEPRVWFSLSRVL